MTSSSFTRDEDASFGSFLRRARETRGLTLEQVAQDTKLPLRHLAALEHDQFAALPGGMYRRAEVRAYADAVGLDRAAALARLDFALDQATPEGARAVHPPLPEPERAHVRAAALAAAGTAIAIAAVTLALWVRQPDAPTSAGPQEQVASPAATEFVPSAGAPVLAPASHVVSQLPHDEVPAIDEPAPTVVAERHLTITTDPPGARVTVNGVGWGTTPVTIRHLAPGAKRVRVTLDGFDAVERVVAIGDSSPAATMHVPMQPPADVARNVP